MIQIPKFIKDTLKYFQYEGSPNPTTQDDLQAFMKSDHSVLECLVDGLWQPETYYKENHVVRSPNMQAGFVARVTKAGTSGSNEPDWGGATATDGTVKWKIQKQGSGGSGATWESSTFYNVDSTVSLEGNSSLFLLCIKSGTSGATQPTVSSEANVTDGSVTWKPIYYKKLPTLDSSNYIKGENLAGYWKASQSVTVGTIRFLHGDKYAGYYLKCTTAGTTGTTQPTPTVPTTGTISDGTAKWSLKEISDAQAIINASIGKYPSWYFDRGDGSNGAFNPSSATTISGVKNYTSVNIPSGVTVTVDGVVRIKCLGAFVNKGKITANGKGAAGGKSITGAVTAKSGKNGGSAYGGAGGTGDHTSGAAGGAIDIFGISNSEFIKTDMPFLIGGGGGGGGGSSSTKYGSGEGGAGGGSIVITANEITNTGSITANGSNGGSPTNTARTGRGGGGGGGSIYLIANVINSNGTITVNGGKGGTGGSDGRYNGAAGAEGLKIIQQLGV